MTKQTSRKSKSQQCVGFLCGGVLKPNTLRFFKSENEDPSEFYDCMTEHYTTNVECKYVSCEDCDELFEKVCDAFSKERKDEKSDLFSVSIASASSKLRDLSGSKSCHSYPKSSKKKADKDDEAGSDSESEEKEEKKSSKKDEPKKLVKKGKKETNNEESEESGDNKSDEESEDEKPQKSSKKSTKKKDDKEDKEDEEDEEEEGPKLKRKGEKGEKKDEKSSKSKSKTK
jgi:hypothetical protein